MSAPLPEKQARSMTHIRAVTNRAPIGFVRCTVHHQLVGTDGDGRLLGCCWGCVREAADAKAKLGRRT